MAMYVDDIREYPVHLIKPAARRYGQKWCHLITDGDEGELVAFARSIGCNVGWIQKKGQAMAHYDLTPSMRIKALEAGAISCTPKEYGQVLQKKIVAWREQHNGQ